MAYGMVNQAPAASNPYQQRPRPAVQGFGQYMNPQVQSWGSAIDPSYMNNMMHAFSGLFGNFNQQGTTGAGIPAGLGTLVQPKLTQTITNNPNPKPTVGPVQRTQPIQRQPTQVTQPVQQPIQQTQPLNLNKGALTKSGKFLPYARALMSPYKG